MRRDEPRGHDRPAGITHSIRVSVAAYVDEIVLFLILNVALVIVVAALVSFAALMPLAFALAPLLALPTAVICRLAVTTARGGSPRWAMVGEELLRRAGRKVVLAALQLLVLGVGLLNVSLVDEIGGVPGMLSLVVSGYAVVASSVFALTLWPIVCDPRRDGPLVDHLRLALSLVLLRPLQLGMLAALTALAMVASIQLVALALILPSLVLLASTDYIVNLADRIRPKPE